MPRVGDTYSLPATYLATTGEVATATQHNDPLEDLETEQNAARPVAAGGTGSATAAGARTNLDVPSNSEAVLVTGAQTVAGAKTFSDTITIDDTATITGDLGVAGTITGDVIGDILDTNGTHIIEGVTTASAVNYLQVANQATGGQVELNAAGTDTNVSLRFNSKGGGGHVFRCNSISRFQVATTGTTTTGSHIVSGAVYKNTSEELTAIVHGTPTATTSGTSVTKTGIPSGSKRVTVTLNGVSTDGTGAIILRLGDSGGIETTGYVGRTTGINGGSAASPTDGFALNSSSGAASTYTGVITLIRHDTSAHLWYAEVNVTLSGGANHFIGSGYKTLSAELSQVSITTTAGTDNLDAGEINFHYE